MSHPEMMALLNFGMGGLAIAALAFILAWLAAKAEQIRSRRQGQRVDAAESNS